MLCRHEPEARQHQTFSISDQRKLQNDRPCEPEARQSPHNGKITLCESLVCS